MAKVNKKKDPIFTHEGAKAQHITAEQRLRRSLMACMLWEDSFYEDGKSVSDRITGVIPTVDPDKVASMAIEARQKMKLRHAPLLVVRNMAKLPSHKHLVATTLERVIQRADELAEFLSIYWKDGKQPLSAQVKRGLASAFGKFNEYQLAKYNQKNSVKLKDVLFLCHAKAKDAEQDALWKRLIEDKLAIPDTWEVSLSAGKDKRQTWERLLAEGTLGAMALLRNLRNMKEAGVNERLVFSALERMKVERILPFRFISAAKYAPQWEPYLEPAMFKCLEGKEKLKGKTAIVVDGSGSMFGTPISRRSEIDRFEAAAALAILAREICEDCTVTVFSNDAFLVPARRGFALRDAIRAKAQHGGTNTMNGIREAAKHGYDRIIVITDEQSHQSASNPINGTKGYFINVATYQNGVGYGQWTHIDGWSEAVLAYIAMSEAEGK